MIEPMTKLEAENQKDVLQKIYCKDDRIDEGDGLLNTNVGLTAAGVVLAGLVLAHLYFRKNELYQGFFGSGSGAAVLVFLAIVYGAVSLWAPSYFHLAYGNEDLANDPAWVRDLRKMNTSMVTIAALFLVSLVAAIPVICFRNDKMDHVAQMIGYYMLLLHLALLGVTIGMVAYQTYHANYNLNEQALVTPVNARKRGWNACVNENAGNKCHTLKHWCEGKALL